MATIITSRTRTVAQSPVSGQKQTGISDPNAFGANVGRATQGLGQSIDQTGDMIQRVTVKGLDDVNRARALDLQTQMENELNDFLYNPKQGLLTKKGRDGLYAPEEMDTKLREIKSKYLDIQGEASQTSSLLEKSYSSISKSYKEIAQRHAFNQSLVYAQDAIDSRISLNRDEAALNYLNEDTFKNKLEDNYTALEEKARLLGWSKDHLDLAKKQEKSALRAAQIASMINTDKPYNAILAKKEFEKARKSGELVYNDMTKLENSLNGVLPKALATVAYDRISQSRQSLNQPADSVWQAMIQQESGGRHFTANGKVVKSQVGAIGIAQLMPETAKEAAKLAGVKFNEDRYKTDPKYNEKLGRAYFEKQVVDFGSTALGAMAYNAGAGAVKDFMNGTNKTGKNKQHIKLGDPRKGETSLEEFITRFPFKETRDYVSNVISNSQGLSQEDVIKTAEDISKIHPDAGTYLINMYKAGVNEQIALQKKQKQVIENEIHKFVAQNNGDWTKLPANLITQAKQLGVDYTKYVGASDPKALNELDSMTSGELFTTDLEKYRDRLAYNDFVDYKKKQIELQNPDNKFLQDKIDAIVTTYYKTKLGKDLTNAKDKRNEWKLAQFKRYIRHEVEVKHKNKKDITYKDLNEIAASYFRNPNYDPEGILNRQENYFLQDVSEIPKKQVEAIIQSIENDGLPVTDEEIKRIYFLGIAKSQIETNNGESPLQGKSLENVSSYESIF